MPKLSQFDVAFASTYSKLAFRVLLDIQHESLPFNPCSFNVFLFTMLRRDCTVALHVNNVHEIEYVPVKCHPRLMPSCYPQLPSGQVSCDRYLSCYSDTFCFVGRESLSKAEAASFAQRFRLIHIVSISCLIVINV